MAEEENQKKTLLGLSGTQLVGGSLAAATSAVMGSGLGLAGTVVGAAVASVVIAVAGAFYTKSIERTRDQLRAAFASGRAEKTNTESEPSGSTPVEPARAVVRPRLVAQMVAGAVAIFAIAFSAITMGESVSGHALSGGQGTTVGQIATSDTRTGGDSTAPDEDPVQAPTTGATREARPTGAPSATSEANPTQTGQPSSQPTGSGSNAETGSGATDTGSGSRGSSGADSGGAGSGGAGSGGAGSGGSGANNSRSGDTGSGTS